MQKSGSTDGKVVEKLGFELVTAVCTCDELMWSTGSHFDRLHELLGFDVVVSILFKFAALVRRFGCIVVILVVFRGIISAFFIGQNRIRLERDGGPIYLWVLCPIVTKTIANGSVDAFNEDIFQGDLVLDANDLP